MGWASFRGCKIALAASAAGMTQDEAWIINSGVGT